MKLIATGPIRLGGPTGIVEHQEGDKFEADKATAEQLIAVGAAVLAGKASARAKADPDADSAADPAADPAANPAADPDAAT